MKALRRWLRPLKRWFNRVFRVDAGIFLSRQISPGCSPRPTGIGLLRDMTDTPMLRDGLPFSKTEFVRRVSAGHKFYELFVNDKPLVYGWVACVGAHVGVLHHLKLTVPDNAIYVWDVATAPEHRGQGLLGIMLDEIFNLHSPSTRVTWSAVAVSNHASRRALAKAGFNPMFTYFTIQVLGRTIFSAVLKKGRLVRAQPVFDCLSLEPVSG